MTYRERLIDQKDPLSVGELMDLNEWLEQLRDDCALFGETFEDRDRMSRIKTRIRQEEQRIARES